MTPHPSPGKEAHMPFCHSSCGPSGLNNSLLISLGHSGGLEDIFFFFKFVSFAHTLIWADAKPHSPILFMPS